MRFPKYRIDLIISHLLSLLLSPNIIWPFWSVSVLFLLLVRVHSHPKRPRTKLSHLLVTNTRHERAISTSIIPFLMHRFLKSVSVFIKQLLKLIRVISCREGCEWVRPNQGNTLILMLSIVMPLPGILLLLVVQFLLSHCFSSHSINIKLSPLRLLLKRNTDRPFYFILFGITCYPDQCPSSASRLDESALVSSVNIPF